ncbi:MAG: BrnT family toxin [Candidatus Shapirobacteria bacterium]
MKQPIKPLIFDWDKGNKDKNWHKHRVNFSESEEVFFNKPIAFFPDRGHSVKEKRFLAYGKTNKERKLTVVFTIRSREIRVISARDQNRKEGNVYEKQQKN